MVSLVVKFPQLFHALGISQDSAEVVDCVLNPDRSCGFHTSTCHLVICFGREHSGSSNFSGFLVVNCCLE